MENLLKLFEKYISYALIIIAMLFVCYQTVDLAINFGAKVIGDIQHQTAIVEEKGKPILSTFFTILLTLEVIQTIKVFSDDHSVKLKVILIVGLIAVTRKILIFDMEEVNPISEFAIAALIISLSAGYYLANRAEKPGDNI
jgi:uncharacterized membrane protein (DUF373 family)